MALETLRFEFQAILNKQVELFRDLIKELAEDLVNDQSSAVVSSTTTDTISFYLLYNLPYKEEVDDLRSLIKKLDAAGCIGDCVDFYKSSRKFILNEKSKHLGLWPCSVNDIRSMDWELLEPKIKLWSLAATIFFTVLFVKEKELYEQIFCSLPNFVYDEGFLGIIYEYALQFINFAQGISFTQPSIMKLFEVLDVYRYFLRDALPSLNAVFRSNLSESVSVREKATRTFDQLAEFIRKMFFAFESTVLQEISSISKSGGTIRLTEFAMDYTTRFAYNKIVLAELIVSQPTTRMEFDDDLVYLEVAGKTPFELHLIWIIRSLKYNLEGKFKLYESTHLGYFFMTNNVNHILYKIEGCLDLKRIIGSEYVSRLEMYVYEAAVNYNKLSWGPVMHCLRNDGVQARCFCTFQASNSTVKYKLKRFDATFNKVFKAQSTWIVLDAELRRRLQSLILEELAPAYNFFLKQHRSQIHTQVRRVKYSVKDIEDKVRELFLQR